jgi:predicted GTPase
VNAAAKDSPILIIGTHVESEQCTEEFLANFKSRLEKKVKQKYTNVVGIHFVSPVTGKNMDQLMTSIRQVVAKQVRPHSTH